MCVFNSAFDTFSSKKVHYFVDCFEDKLCFKDMYHQLAKSSSKHCGEISC